MKEIQNVYQVKKLIQLKMIPRYVHLVDKIIRKVKKIIIIRGRICNSF